MNVTDNDTYVWNPWHGCHRCGKGCLKCYVFENDKMMNINTEIIKQNKSQFRLPVQKIRDKTKKKEKHELEYKIPSGSTILTCMTSDFFIEEADALRDDAWQFIHDRYDCLFVILTRRPERINQTLPDNWLDGWENVRIGVSVEDNYHAWLRVPILLESKARHKSISISPMLEKVDLRPFLSSGEVEEVEVSGEQYKGFEYMPTELKIDWVKDIQQQCKEYEVTFKFNHTGTLLNINNQTITVPKRDGYNLASFYNLDYLDKSYPDWHITASELLDRKLAESAHMVYTKIMKGKYRE